MQNMHAAMTCIAAAVTRRPIPVTRDTREMRFTLGAFPFILCSPFCLRSHQLIYSLCSDQITNTTKAAFGGFSH